MAYRTSSSSARARTTQPQSSRQQRRNPTVDELTPEITRDKTDNSVMDDQHWETQPREEHGEEAGAEPQAIFWGGAPRYWKREIPVIPLIGKRPFMTGWQRFGIHMPSQEEMTEWLTLHPCANIGLPCGPASGITAIDRDSEDPRVIRVLER